MAERPKITIRQVEETPTPTTSAAVLSPAILGDLRLAVTKGDTSSTYDKTTGTVVSYPFIESGATPTVRYLDDRILGKHTNERVYSEWDLLLEAQDMVDELLDATDVYSAMQRTEAVLGSTGSPPLVITLDSSPIIKDTLFIYKDTGGTPDPATDYFIEGTDYTVNYTTGVVTVITSSALDTWVSTTGQDSFIEYSPRPCSSVDDTKSRAVSLLEVVVSNCESSRISSYPLRSSSEK